MKSCRCRVWASLPSEIHEYFFRRVLAGETHAKQDLTRQFYLALYEECHRRKIPETWHTDNPGAVKLIMADLNFNHGTQTPRS
jgi:hypothetical protein